MKYVVLGHDPTNEGNRWWVYIPNGKHQQKVFKKHLTVEELENLTRCQANKLLKHAIAEEAQLAIEMKANDHWVVFQHKMVSRDEWLEIKAAQTVEDEMWYDGPDEDVDYAFLEQEENLPEVEQRNGEPPF